MILVIGTNDSGKSQLAETLTEKFSNNEKAAYIATMIPFDEEGEKRIERHRKMRENKNFLTFEEPLNVKSLIDRFNMEGINTALLECVSNLTGNVIHSPENADRTETELTDIIADDISALSDHLDNLVVVANDFVLKDEYDTDTERYIRINNSVTERLKLRADRYYMKEEGEWTFYDNN